MRDKTSKLTMRPGAAIRFTFTFDGCIDASATSGDVVVKTTMSGTGTTISRGVQTVTERDVRFTERQTITPAEKTDVVKRKDERKPDETQQKRTENDPKKEEAKDDVRPSVAGRWWHPSAAGSSPEPPQPAPRVRRVLLVVPEGGYLRVPVDSTAANALNIAKSRGDETVFTDLLSRGGGCSSSASPAGSRLAESPATSSPCAFSKDRTSARSAWCRSLS
jgi:hypothetical protein